MIDYAITISIALLLATLWLLVCGLVCAMAVEIQTAYERWS